MKNDSIGRMIRFAALILPLTWIPASALGQMQAVKAESFGVSVTAAGVNQKTPSAVLSAGGGLVQDEATSVTVATFVTAENAFAIATGESDGPNSDAVSSATLGTVNILNGLITADGVVAMASSTQEGSNADGSGLSNLVVNGVEMSNPAPNTQVNLPGVGYVVLNEQISTAGGGITVNMIHVVLQGALGATTGEIVVGSASTRVN